MASGAAYLLHREKQDHPQLIPCLRALGLLWPSPRLQRLSIWRRPEQMLSSLEPSVAAPTEHPRLGRCNSAPYALLHVLGEVQSYGLSESSGSLALMVWPEECMVYSSISKLLLHLQAKIVDPKALGPGQRAEIDQGLVAVNMKVSGHLPTLPSQRRPQARLIKSIPNLGCHVVFRHLCLQFICQICRLHMHSKGRFFGLGMGACVFGTTEVKSVHMPVTSSWHMG